MSPGGHQDMSFASFPPILSLNARGQTDSDDRKLQTLGLAFLGPGWFCWACTCPPSSLPASPQLPRTALFIPLPRTAHPWRNESGKTITAEEVQGSHARRCCLGEQRDRPTAALSQELWTARMCLIYLHPNPTMIIMNHTEEA